MMLYVVTSSGVEMLRQAQHDIRDLSFMNNTVSLSLSKTANIFTTNCDISTPLDVTFKTQITLFCSDSYQNCFRI